MHCHALVPICHEATYPGSGVDAGHFWQSLQSIVAEFGPRNKALLQKRDALQTQIDDWHVAHADKQHDPQAYKAFLQSIGYLVSAPHAVKIDTDNVDAEIARIAGPQLVVPLDNARYVLNAANARWGSLYDALYGTNAIAEDNGCEIADKYNPIRGDRIIDFARDFLDRHFALDKGSHRQATEYCIVDGQLVVRLGNGNKTCLLRPERLVGYCGDAANPEKLLLCKMVCMSNCVLVKAFLLAVAITPISMIYSLNRPSVRLWIVRIRLQPSMSTTNWRSTATGWA